MLLFVTAVAVVLIVSFMCSVFESVLLSLTRPQIEILTRDGRRAGPLLADFKENMDMPIAAILILNTAAHTVGAAVAGASYSSVFDASTLWVFSILFTLAVLLFTEIIPKTLGVTYALTLASPVAHGIRWLTVLLRPFVIVSERISRKLRGDDAQMPVTSAEEIRLLALLGKSEGVMGGRTAGIIVGATQLRDMQAHDILLPRNEVCFLSALMDRDTAIQYIRENRHSRFPFSPSENLEDATHVVLTKDLLNWLLEHDDQIIDWEALCNDALIVPASTSLPNLLRTYQQSHRHLAIIVDEYGSVEGIATLEDLFEEIVGTIYDESDTRLDDIVEGQNGELEVQATVDLRRLSARLDIPWTPEAEVSTIGGLVTEKLQRIPVAGDSIQWNGYRVTVVSASRRRIQRLSIHKLPNEQSD